MVDVNELDELPPLESLAEAKFPETCELWCLMQKRYILI